MASSEEKNLFIYKRLELLSSWIYFSFSKLSLFYWQTHFFCEAIPEYYGKTKIW